MLYYPTYGRVGGLRFIAFAIVFLATLIVSLVSYIGILLRRARRGEIDVAESVGIILEELKTK